MKIKKLVRSGIVETNSSSSHAICICPDQNFSRQGDDSWDIDFIEPGVLYIPSPGGEFGRQYFKSNGCLMKIQYAYGLALSFDVYSAARFQERILRVIKQMTGATEVRFEWKEEFNKKLKENFGDFNAVFVDSPSVDHQSTDLTDELFENDDTLRDFLFNPKSWLIGGSDDEMDFEKQEKHIVDYSADETLSARVVVHLGEDFGDIDIIVADITFFDGIDIEDVIKKDDRLFGLSWTGSKFEYAFAKRETDKWGYSANLKDLVYIEEDCSYKLAFYRTVPLSPEEESTPSVRADEKVHHNRVGATSLEEIQKLGLVENVDFKLVDVTIESDYFGRIL